MQFRRRRRWINILKGKNANVQEYPYHRRIVQRKEPLGGDKLFRMRLCSLSESDISMLDEDKSKAIERRVIEDVEKMRDKIEELDGSMIIITLETGFSVTPSDPSQAALRRILGIINQRIANTSNEVYFSASGIQFKIK